MMELGPIVTLIGSIVLILLKAWQEGKPGRQKEEESEKKMQGRTDILNGDTGAVVARLGRVLDAQAATSGGDAGGAGGPYQTGSSVTAERLGAFGISVSEDAGTGGKVPG